jgi:hypothetical protein
LIVIVPKYDWEMDDFDGESEMFLSLSCLTNGKVRQQMIALADLPEGSVPEDGDSWEAKFNRDSVYPPIIVECTKGTFAITHGNHRLRMWKKWGFTHAPCFVWTPSN